MPPRQSSISLVTRPQAALTVSSAATPMGQHTVALVSERNFYKNKVRVLELDLARLRLQGGSDDTIGRAPDDLFLERLAIARAGAETTPVASVRTAEKSSAGDLATLAASNAAALRRQAANHQLAMANAEARFNSESALAALLSSKLTALRALQASPPYRVARRLSRWGRFWKRLGRRLMRRR